MNKTIVKRIYSLTCISIILVLLVTTIIHIYNTGNRIQHEAYQIVDMQTDVAMEVVESWLDGRKNYVSSFAYNVEKQQLYLRMDEFVDFISDQANNPSFQNYEFDKVYFADLEGNFWDSKGWNSSDFDPRVREWYIGAMDADGIYVTKPYKGAGSGANIITVSTKVYDEKNNVVGVVGANTFLDLLFKEVEVLRNPDGGYIFIINDEQEVLVHFDENYLTKEEKYLTLHEVNADFDKVLEGDENEINFGETSSGESVYGLYRNVPNTAWKIISNYPSKYVNQTLAVEFIRSVAIGTIAIVVTMLFIKKLTREYIKPLEKVVDVLESVKEGNLDLNVSLIPKNSYELNALVNSTETISIFLKSYIGEIAEILECFANGDFTANTTQKYIGDFSAINTSINNITVSLIRLLKDTTDSAVEVGAGAKQIANSAQNLADLTQNQNVLVEGFKQDTNNIFNSVSESINEIQITTELIHEVSQRANEGKDVMEQMVTAIKAINKSTEKISEVIQGIESIAQETNILALNASIEASRAGEAGKSFSVVATQVRELSINTSKIVKQINTLLEDNLNSVKQGENMVDLTSHTLQEIISSVEKTTEASKNLTKNTSNQKQLINQLSKGSEELSDGIKYNADISTENLAISEELTAHAEALKAQLQRFKIS
ncbi:hypothetical protein AN639_04165 [Candidatus Epulonipiscium fishelsonii]|uniref:Uncharacterized protein n=1 Tax=Candidatus Epulonipiscium fishelsonii TaxID=77094 RepID=A0ACC8X9Z5_9FIRM|nr:hypothetical protein AN396_09655 [Epulopiscium sp. SCG-B11WGA-EpuloA1]ONI40913.1 hypothetical protein AN639_04165 [Epulopiscium sp. SCG-B05WGA-EpuloA1]